MAIGLLASTIPAVADAQYYRDRGYRGPPPAVVYERSGYPDRGYASPPPPYGYRGPPSGYGYRGPPPQRYRRCNRGGGGSIIGAIAGGLLGNAAAGRGDRGVGTILGAGAGALAGREIGRDC